MPFPLDLELAAGHFRAHRFGAEGGRLTICVHGLSANSRSFDYLGESLSLPGSTVVAMDLRGRGWSEITAPGTYGWANHARDVVHVAMALGATTFDYVGHSMGAYVGMELARRAPDRVRRLALIDAIGAPEPAAMPSIFAAVARLGASHTDADAYIAAVKKLGTIEPWNATWETHYRYDLVRSGQSVASRTDKAAVMEDVAYAGGQQPRTFWPRLTMETLLLRAGVPLGGGFIVSEEDRRSFLSTAPRARAVDVMANHYGIMTDPTSAEHLRNFFK